MSQQFTPLTPPALSFFIVVGLLAGAIGWTLIRARFMIQQQRSFVSSRPCSVLSLIPDVLVGVAGSMRGVSWGAVAALTIAHLIVTVCGVAAYRLVLPLPGPRGALIRGTLRRGCCR